MLALMILLGVGGPGTHGSRPFGRSDPTWDVALLNRTGHSRRGLCMRGAYPLKQPASEIHGRADPVITRATERLTHAFNDEEAYLVDRRP
jgi:hypothetical protein